MAKLQTILSIGEATLDNFMFISDANVHCTMDKRKCEFCMNYASKVIADQMAFSVGGNAANTAVTFARLGMTSQLYVVIGDDWIGQRIHKTLDAEGIDCQYIQKENGPTSYATALVFQGERNLVIYHVPRNYLLPKLDPVDWIYLTNLGKNFQDAYRRTYHFANEHSIPVSLNPGNYQLKAGLAVLKPFLAKTEILFVNREEAQMLTELSVKATIRHLAEGLYDFGVKTVVITDGASGAYCFDGSRLLFLEIFPTHVVERTGTGDAFGSAFTAARAIGKDLAEAMRWGMANAAGVVAEIGPEAGLLTTHQMNEMLKQYSHITAKPISA